MKTITAKSLESCFSIAIVVSRFNTEVTTAMVDGALVRLKELGFQEEQITQVWVPGAIEIPLTAQRLARTGDFEAIVVLGAVIRGETTHYDYVCEQVSEGCGRLALEADIPVIFGVLTTENVAQAIDRLGGKHGHKARDAIDAAYEMVSVLSQVGAF
jgi:6,7-dimethyl-8-ribityllumazine synthase